MSGSAPASLPIAALTAVGILLVVLGLFVGGEIALVIIGIVALGLAGMLGVVAGRRG